MKRKSLGLALFALAMLGFAASAGAADGTIDINYAVVAQGGSSPCGSGTTFPCNISIPGSYRLSGNLGSGIPTNNTIPTGVNAINVSAGGVTIDLNGFAILGPGSSSTGIGINVNTRMATVENGTVSGFGVGVVVGWDGIVRNVHADYNGNGIETQNNSVVQGCTANNTLSTGIQCSTACLISGNTANGNPGGGITCGFPGNGNGCVISGNTLIANGTGINCAGIGCLITGNTVASTTSWGITVFDATSGYGSNVVYSDGSSSYVQGGTSMGNNVIGGVLK